MDGQRIKKLLFLSGIESALGGLELQRIRIFEPIRDCNLNISPVHDADFYTILLRRLYRQMEEFAAYDSRVANLKGRYKALVGKIKIRDHFEHGVDSKKLQVADITQFPGIIKVAGPHVKVNLVIARSIMGDKIVSGQFIWNLHKDHEEFVEMIRKMTNLYPFAEPVAKKMKKLTILEAFEAMKVFLDSCYERTHSGELGGLLGGLQFLEDGDTADPAQWHDWEESVEKVLTHGYKPSKLELLKK